MLDQHAGLRVRPHLRDLLEQVLDAPLLFGHESLCRECLGLFGVHHLLAVFVLRDVLVAGDYCAARHRGEPVVERIAEGGERTGQPAPVDRHHESDGGLLVARGVVVGRADVVFDGVVEGSLRVGHLDFDVADNPLGNRRRDHAPLVVLPEQVTGVAAHPVADRTESPQDRQGRPTLGGREPPERDRTLVPEGFEDGSAVNGTEPVGDVCHVGVCHSAAVRLHLLKHLGQLPHGFVGWVPSRRREILDERVSPATPALRQSEEIQQVPEFDRVDLHRRRRQEQQRLRLRPERLQQPQEVVRTALLGRAR